MLHKHPLISLFLVLALFLASAYAAPANAQGTDDDFPVTVELTGVIKSISSTELALVNGPVIKINPGTKDIAPGLQAGMTVVVVAEMDDEQFVAKSIQVAKTEPGTSPDDTKGNGNGKDKDKDKGKGNADKGKGQGNGNGQDKNKDKGNGKANKAKAECLARTDHPVATQLADVFNVTYAEIQKWHCEGIGFGEIARAYVIMKNSKLSVEQIFAMREAHQGWGQILKAARLNGKDIAGLGKLKGQGSKKDK